MGRRNKIKPPLSAAQRIEADRILGTLRALLDFVDGLGSLARDLESEAAKAEGDLVEAFGSEAAVARRREEHALAELLDVLRNRPSITKRFDRVLLHAAVEEAVAAIERLRTPWRDDPYAHALRKTDRRELPRAIRFIQRLQGGRLEDVATIRERLPPLLASPPEPEGFRGGDRARAAAVLSEFIDMSAPHIERIVQERRAFTAVDRE